VAIHPHLHFQIDDPEEKTRIATLYIQEMAKRGCHGYASFYLNGAQGDAEVDQTVSAARESFSLMARGLAEGTLDQLLECDPQKDYFRRIVR
jgi:glutamate-1-semialdehyde 2,1-aminomutase